MTILRKIEVGAVAALTLFGAGQSWHVKRLEAEVASVAHARDSLLIDNAAEAARADGWATRFADTTRSIAGLLAAQDSQARALSRSLEAAHAHETMLAELVAGLKDSLTSVASSVDTIAGGQVRYSGALDDGLLTGSWRFLAPALSLDYSARVPIQIVTSRGGDGRWLITARATDPRASVEVQQAVINPPPPVIERRGPSWWWVLGALGAGWLGRDALAALGSH